MTADGCNEVRHSLGAYVLGALDPGDRSRVDAHLATCSDCRDELASFAGLPGLLGRVTRSQAEAEIAPSSGQLLDRVLKAAAAERRHDRRVRQLTSVAAAALVVVLAIGTAVGLTQTRHKSPRAIVGASQTFSATDPVTHVTASVTEVKKGWGATLQVTVSGAELSAAYNAGVRCQLVAVGPNGETDIAGSWAPPAPGHNIEAIGATALKATDITAFQIVGSDGTTLVSVPARWAANA
jgi:anti-sigma factor RsiW